MCQADEEQQDFSTSTEDRMETTTEEQRLCDSAKIREHPAALQQAIQLPQSIHCSTNLWTHLRAAITHAVSNQIEREHSEEIDEELATFEVGPESCGLVEVPATMCLEGGNASVHDGDDGDEVTEELIKDKIGSADRYIESSMITNRGQDEELRENN